jgi:hypothetical protein
MHGSIANKSEKRVARPVLMSSGRSRSLAQAFLRKRLLVRRDWMPSEPAGRGPALTGEKAGYHRAGGDGP